MDSNIIEKTKEKLAEYEERHEKILQAAIKLFNENGYPGTTTASIAKKAGVTEKTMYRHYQNKMILFRECILSIVAELTDLWQKELKEDDGNGTAYLKAIAASYVNFVRNNPDKSMFMVHLYSYRAIPELDKGFKEFVDSRINDTEKIIGAMQKKGTIKSSIHPRVLAGIFIGQYFSVVFLSEFVKPELLNEDIVLELVNNVMKIN